MNKHNDGGPVFPTTQNVVHPTQGIVVGQIITGGMTLRDYFAAAAITADWMGDHSIHEQAELAYKVADAMLAERAKRKEAQP